MAQGDIVSSIATVHNNETLDIRPTGAAEWIIKNIGYAGAMNLYYYDGTNTVKVDTDSAAGSRMGAVYHCTNSKYYKLENVSGGDALMGYNGIQTDGVAASATELDDLTIPVTVAHSSNTYTLDMLNKYLRVFDIETADATAKTIALSNVPNAVGRLVQVIVRIKCTAAAVFTHPTGSTFAAGTPTFTTGQEYWVSYDSFDGGTTWAGLSVRRK